MYIKPSHYPTQMYRCVRRMHNPSSSNLVKHGGFCVLLIVPTSSLPPVATLQSPLPPLHSPTSYLAKLISFVGISPIKTLSQLTVCPLCLRSTLVILSAWLYHDSYGSYAKCLIEGWSYPASSVPSSQISRLHSALGPSLRRCQNLQYSSP